MKKFVCRDTEAYYQITKPQTKVFPAKEQLSYDNYLVEILDCTAYPEFNFKLSNGTTSQFKL